MTPNPGPRSQRQVFQTRPVRSVPGLSPDPRNRVLLVEDDPEEADLYVRSLRDYGWTVEVAHRPGEALRLLVAALEGGHPYRAVLIDRQLDDPRTAGASAGAPFIEWGPYAGDRLLEIVVRDHSDTPALMLTKTPDCLLSEELRRKGAAGYLIKGYDRGYRNPTEFVHEQLRMAVHRHALRAVRHRLLSLPSTDDLLRSLFPLLRDSLANYDLDAGTLNLTLVLVDPSQGCWALLARPDPCNPAPLVAAGGRPQEWVSISASDALAQLIDGPARFHRSSRPDNPASSTLTAGSAWQLLVPVRLASPTGRSERLQTHAVLAVEGDGACLLSDEDAAFVEDVAAVVGDFIGLREYYRAYAQPETHAELQRMQRAMTSLVSAPLAKAQGELEVLRELESAARPVILAAGGPRPEPPPPDRVASALAALYAAIAGIDRIGHGLYDVALLSEPVDLRELLAAALERTGEIRAAGGLQVDGPAPGPPLRVRLDRPYSRAALESYISGTARLARTARRDGRSDGLTRLFVELNVHPKHVHLTLSDDGPPWDDYVLREQYGHAADRFGLDTTADLRRLALWLMRWVLEGTPSADGQSASLGRIQVRNPLGGGAAVDIVLPRCER